MQHRAGDETGWRTRDNEASHQMRMAGGVRVLHGVPRKINDICEKMWRVLNGRSKDRNHRSEECLLMPFSELLRLEVACILPPLQINIVMGGERNVNSKESQSR